MKFSKIVILLSLFIVTPELTVANSPHVLVENTFFKDSLVQNTEIGVRTSYGFYAHHHFEMSGFSEQKIVMLFSFVAFIGCIIALLAIIFNW